MRADYYLESPVKKIMKHSKTNGDITSGKKIIDVDTIAPPIKLIETCAYHSLILTASIAYHEYL